MVTINLPCFWESCLLSHSKYPQSHLFAILVENAFLFTMAYVDSPPTQTMASMAYVDSPPTMAFFMFLHNPHPPGPQKDRSARDWNAIGGRHGPYELGAGHSSQDGGLQPGWSPGGGGWGFIIAVKITILYR